MRVRHKNGANRRKRTSACRRPNGVSLDQLQQRTGITKSSLSRLENDPNASPTINTLQRIAEALQMQIRISLDSA